MNKDYCYDPADRNDLTKELKETVVTLRRMHMRGYFECDDEYYLSPTKWYKSTRKSVPAIDMADYWSTQAERYDDLIDRWKYNPRRTMRGYTDYPKDHFKDFYTKADITHRRVHSGVDDSFRFRCIDKKSGSTRNKEAVDGFGTKSLETLAMFNPKLVPARPFGIRFAAIGIVCTKWRTK